MSQSECNEHSVMADDVSDEDEPTMDYFKSSTFAPQVC
jgi:hypothetical protein